MNSLKNNNCEICKEEKTLYFSINKQWVCNPCSQLPNNKWLGQNNWLFADGLSAK